MDTSPAIEAARRFLAVAWEGPVPDDAALTAALDRLLAAYHDAPEGGVSHGAPDARDGDGDDAAFRRTLGERFPDYGFYPVADPMEEPRAAASVGDAIDDLGDIIRDMREVVWLADNVGADDAHWLLRLLFFHWGTHARDLLRYLHGRQVG